MHAQPRLIPVGRPRSPEAAVLVLHGGASRGDRMMVSPAQLSVLRMIPTARVVARAGGGRLAVYRRTERPCYRCGRPIHRIVVGQRSTHFCPHCQPEPVASRP